MIRMGKCLEKKKKLLLSSLSQLNLLLLACVIRAEAISGETDWKGLY